MATNTILAADVTAAEQEFTVPAGGLLDLYLTAADGVEEIPQTAELLIQKKSGTRFVTHFRLNRNLSGIRLNGGGPWKAKRRAQDANAAVGLDSET